MNIENLRKDYSKHELLESDCPENPILLLNDWLKEEAALSLDANAMTLSTVDANGAPSSRIVLVRKVENRGLSFFTNYLSEKGQQMAINSKVAVNFFWPRVERQVRIQGSVEKLSPEESDAYFKSRPRASQIGAWASDQSQRIDRREELEDKLAHYELKFKDKEVDRPPHWGGYLIKPSKIEFWQGRPSRLHDRIRYTVDRGAWLIERLNP